MRFAQQLRNLRLKNHMTQDELAELLNVSRFTVSMMENCRRYPSTYCVDRICGIFKVSPEALFSDENINPHYEETREETIISKTQNPHIIIPSKNPSGIITTLSQKGKDSDFKVTITDKELSRETVGRQYVTQGNQRYDCVGNNVAQPIKPRSRRNLSVNIPKGYKAIGVTLVNGVVEVIVEEIRM